MLNIPPPPPPAPAPAPNGPALPDELVGGVPLDAAGWPNANAGLPSETVPVAGLAGCDPNPNGLLGAVVGLPNANPPPPVAENGAGLGGAEPPPKLVFEGPPKLKGADGALGVGAGVPKLNPVAAVGVGVAAPPSVFWPKLKLVVSVGAVGAAGFGCPKAKPPLVDDDDDDWPKLNPPGLDSAFSSAFAAPKGVAAEAPNANGPAPEDWLPNDDVAGNGKPSVFVDLPSSVIPRVGLSSMLTSSSCRGGVTGRAGGADAPNENAFLGASLAAPPGAAPKENMPPLAPGAGVVPLGVPNVNGDGAFFSGAGGVEGAAPNENGPFA
jgi:hypothetical protein